MTTVSSEKATNLLCFTIINARYLFFLLCVRKVMVKNYEDKQRNGKFSKHSATLLPSARTHTHTHTHTYTHTFTRLLLLLLPPAPLLLRMPLRHAVRCEVECCRPPSFIRHFISCSGVKYNQTNCNLQFPRNFVYSGGKKFKLQTDFSDSSHVNRKTEHG